MNIIEVPIADVVPYARNPRKNGAAIAIVAASLREFGWQQPIVVDGDMVVVVGHTRLEAARSLGMATVPVHVAKNLSPQQAQAYRLMDNRSGEHAEWDYGLLRLELSELSDEFGGVNAVSVLTGFDAATIEDLVAGQPDSQKEPGGTDAEASSDSNRCPNCGCILDE